MDVRGKTVLVTGAASGIGLALTGTFLREGARVVMVDGDPAGLATASASLSGHAGAILSIVHDVRDRDGWNSICDRVIDGWGHVHVICNNAGISTPRAPVGSLDPDLWDRAISVNLTGVFNGCHVFLSRLRDPSGPGHIVNTASVCGLFATQGMSAYSASKHAVVALSDAIRFERQNEDLGVTVLCPGFVSTAIAANSAQHARTPTAPERAAMIVRLAESLSAGRVAEAVLEAIRQRRAYVFTHPEYADVLAARQAVLEAEFQASAPADPADDIRVLGADWLDG